jgi:acyl carrier protein
MNRDQEIKQLLAQELQIDTDSFDASTALLGAVPELDSMGVVTLLTALEAKYEIVLADDEIDASVFETLGTLCNYVTGKLQ